MNTDTLTEQQALVDAFFAWVKAELDPDAQILQTHVSWVILRQDRAWKIKKAIWLPFLDYSSIEQRRHFCQRELELNGQSAGDLYLGVRALGRDQAGQFHLDGDGPVLEYLVEMSRFDQSGLLSNLLDSDQATAPSPSSPRPSSPSTGPLGDGEIVELARHIGEFHLNCQPPSKEDAGDFARTRQEIIDNFDAVDQASPDDDQRRMLGEIRSRTLDELDRSQELIERRQADGFVRLCHGDLHLGNLVWHQNRPLMFDRIEFSTDFSEIDTVKDLAFLYMDLISFGHPRWAALLADVWAQTTGDYDGLRLLRPFACYRTMVRAKIASIGATQNPGDADLKAQIWQRVELAARFVAPERRCLVMMHGTTGIGKSTVATHIAGAMDALLLHSDVVRKQLLGLSGQPVGADQAALVYSANSTEATYGRLAELAGACLESGYSVVIDASFLDKGQRERFVELAGRAGADCLIVSPQCPEELQKGYLAGGRTGKAGAGGGVSDGNLEVLKMQESSADPLDEAEQALEWRIDIDKPLDTSRLAKYRP